MEGRLWFKICLKATKLAEDNFFRHYMPEKLNFTREMIQKGFIGIGVKLDNERVSSQF